MLVFGASADQAATQISFGCRACGPLRLGFGSGIVVVWSLPGGSLRAPRLVGQVSDQSRPRSLWDQRGGSGVAVPGVGGTALQFYRAWSRGVRSPRGIAPARKSNP